MKRCITLLLIFLYSTLLFSQELAIQGIARDVNGTVKENETLTFIFDLYYLNTSNAPISIYSNSKTVTTDAFGVFSTTIDISTNIESLISNKDTYLKISEGALTISDEQLRTVPYATSALNGVPTGGIMPYMGTTAPDGWLLCNGAAIPITENTKALRGLLNSTNTPNLQGMFLRGTGLSSVNNQPGPNLGETQNDEFKSHNHSSGTLTNSTDGEHIHNWEYPQSSDEDGNGITSILSDNDYQGDWNIETESSGSHSHTITGNTSNTGGAETRPVNYGVNYIIKL